MFAERIETENDLRCGSVYPVSRRQCHRVFLWILLFVGALGGCSLNGRLMDACENGDTSTVKKYLANGGDINRIIDEEEHYTMLLQSLFWKQTELANFLLDCGADANIRGRKTLEFQESGDTALHFAVYFGDLELMKKTLAFRPNLKIRGLTAVCDERSDENGAPMRHVIIFGAGHFTPLEIAVKWTKRNKREAVKLLLENGADVNDDFSLVYAATQDNAETLDLLLEYVKDINKFYLYNYNEQRLYTLMHEAASYGRIKAIKLLLNKGADINLKNYENKTPLFYAVINDHIATVEYLLSMGADPNIADSFGLTALGYAKSEEMKNLLINK